MLHPPEVRKPVVSLVPVPMVDVIAARELALFEPVQNPMQVLVVAPDGMVCDSFRQGLPPTVRTHKLFPDPLQDALQKA
jgi:hypothetical protein